MSSKTNKSKILNPYNKKMIPINESKGKKIDKLVKKCKICEKDKIYDIEKHVCVKRTPGNLKKLHEFDKFCKKYSQEKIKQKDTDKLFFGKLLNISLPGGKFKVKDIIGKTKAKRIAYEIEKNNESKLQYIKIILPVIVTLGSVLIALPGLRSVIYSQIIKILPKKSIFKDAFNNLKPKSNDTIIVTTESLLTVNIQRDDELTKEFISKKEIGTINNTNNTANVNTKKMGINGVRNYSNLSNYTLKYDIGTDSFELDKYNKPLVFALNFYSNNTSNTGQENNEITNLKGIVIENFKKISKINSLKNNIDLISKDITRIKNEQSYIDIYDNYNNNINTLVNTNIELQTRIDSLNIDNTATVTNSRAPLDQSLVKRKDIYIKNVKTNEKDITDLKNKINKMFEEGKLTTEMVSKYKNNDARNLVINIIAHYSELRLIYNKISKENINALYEKIQTIIEYLSKKVYDYDNFLLNNNSFNLFKSPDKQKEQVQVQPQTPREDLVGESYRNQNIGLFTKLAEDLKK